MPIIDFKEIPVANTGKGNQDTFELFARDFFYALGFEIEENPSRGPDGGKDIIVIEPLEGKIKSTKRRWIVSCKHYAHSKKAISDKDEIDILGRVRKFKASGFIGFYSRVPSSGLMQTLRSHETEIAVEVWDNERIESQLATSKSLQVVFQRYFPKSYRIWREKDKSPTKVVGEYTPLECVICRKDLLVERSGIVAHVCKQEYDPDKEEYIDVYWVCRGKHDEIMQQRYKGPTSWEDIDDLSIPLVYIRWLLVTLNNIRSGSEVYTDTAFEKFKHFTFCMSQIVVRETTPEQWERIQDLTSIPSWMGGLGE